MLRPEKSAPPEWIARVERLSELCAAGPAKTHIAFLGTAMLAKAYNRHADLFAIKPDHAPNNANAFSARTLCHKVWVPLAAEFGVSIGVTGREPLNNQPYFRMTRLDDGTPVHPGAQASFDYMVGLVRELTALPNEKAASEALHAFVVVRRRYRVSYAAEGAEVPVSALDLTEAIRTLVSEDAEGGRRAQAVVAGLLDIVSGSDRVESGRINDPSRKHPGDVCVRMAAPASGWEKAFEVRDKPVSISDIRVFCVKCLAMGAREAAVVAVSDRQGPLDEAELALWANSMGVGLTVFIGWDVFVDQALFWAAPPKPEAATLAVSAIHRRLVGVEASSAAIDLWATIIRQ